MNIIECEKCGSPDFVERKGLRICKYCGASYSLSPQEVPLKKANIDISIRKDIDDLIRKCRIEPKNAQKYAHLILDIDPNNLEAKRILNSTSGSCYIATSVYGSYDCPQVWTLRRYRNISLAKTWYGRRFIRIYYGISPLLVHRFGEKSWFRNIWKPILDRMVFNLNLKGIADTPYTDARW